MQWRNRFQSDHCARARSRKDVAAFHVSVTGYPEIDESRYAKQITGMLGIDLFTCQWRKTTSARNLRAPPTTAMCRSRIQTR